MIEVAMFRVRPEEVERLRAWLAELTRRADEVRETFANEGVNHERAYLLTTTDGPILIYAMEAADHQKASEAYQHSTLPIDLEHRQVMREVLAGPAGAELLYDMAR
jgi:Family of unknown function (DUF6176)